MKLWAKILIALALGTLTGLLLADQAQDPNSYARYFLNEIMRPIGDLFLNLIHMIIPLLVLASMTIGITSIHDPEKLGRIGIKTLLLYLATTIVAVCFGLLFGFMFAPGSGGEQLLGVIEDAQANITSGPLASGEAPSIAAILLSVIPQNPIVALAEENVLQIIVFAIFLGIAINFAGEKGRQVKDVLESLAEVMYRLTSIVMEFSPVGVFAIMAWVAGSFGVQVLTKLAMFLIAYYSALIFHVVIVFIGILVLFAKLNPWPFFRGMGDAIMVAFSTASSSATLPVSMHCVQKNLGVSKNITGFVLPLGSTVNMNGSAIFQGMAVLFVSQVYGIHLEWNALILIVITAVLSAVGAAGIPGTGIIMLAAVLRSAGLPVEGLFLLLGIDRVRDMGSTVVNILGDAVAAVYIAKQEGELDERQYNHEELVELEESDA